MSIIRVHDKNFEPYISAGQIGEKIQGMADRLNQDYAGKKPLFLAILNGAFMFAADLFKNISIESEISFIKLASYKGTRSSGQVITAIGLDIELFNSHVVIVKDMDDTGKTLDAFLPQLHHQQPASLKIVALLHKPAAMIFPIP